MASDFSVFVAKRHNFDVANKYTKAARISR